MLEDRLLVWRIKHGSAEALGRLYEKYEHDLLTIAANLLGAGADDVVQDVFIRFVESAEKFSFAGGNLKGYLTTCVANRARDVIRKRQRQRAVAINEAEQIPSNAAGPVQLAVRSEQLQLLACAMAELPYEQREAVVLHLLGEMKFRRIAKLQNVTIKTAQSRYRYGLDKLRSILNGEVIK